VVDQILGFLPVEHFVGCYGYWAVFMIVGLESAGLPLPGEITLISASIIAAATPALDIRWVIFVAAAGAILGDNVGYWIGREFGFRLLVRYGGRVGIGERQIKMGQYLFLKHGGKVVFFGRMVAVLRVLAALLAGINRLPWPHFLACNVGGGILWAIIYGGGAYLFGRQIQEVAGPAGFAALVASVVLLFLSARYIKGHQRTLEAAAEKALPGPLADARHWHHRGS
jgi:membrane protein DedA with SNARE-associated domain